MLSTVARISSLHTACARGCGAELRRRAVSGSSPIRISIIRPLSSRYPGKKGPEVIVCRKRGYCQRACTGKEFIQCRLPKATPLKPRSVGEEKGIKIVCSERKKEFPLNAEASYVVNRENAVLEKMQTSRQEDGAGGLVVACRNKVDAWLSGRWDQRPASTSECDDTGSPSHPQGCSSTGLKEPEEIEDDEPTVHSSPSSWKSPLRLARS